MGTEHPEPTKANSAGNLAGRRRVLRLGVLGAAAVVSVKPALANTMASVINCQIPVPDPGHVGQYIAVDGSTVPPLTPGAFPAPGAPFKGQDVKNALAGAPLPGTTVQSNQAYLNYIRKLQMGQSGFTCYASLQMPGR